MLFGRGGGGAIRVCHSPKGTPRCFVNLLIRFVKIISLYNTYCLLFLCEGDGTRFLQNYKPIQHILHFILGGGGGGCSYKDLANPHIYDSSLNCHKITRSLEIVLCSVPVACGATSQIMTSPPVL